MRGGKRFQQEVFRGLRISRRAQKEIERITLRIDRSVQIHPLLFDLDGGLVNPARESAVGFRMGTAAFLQFGSILLNPTEDRGMIDVQTALEHHLWKAHGNSRA
jgi:hypothetical protein